MKESPSSRARAGERKLSIVDVASHAQVSMATASRVLSGSSYPVRAETRARVLQAAAELDYRPSLLARALATNRTATLGAIVHDISDPYFGEIVRGLEDRARAAEYQVFVCSSDRDAERELEYVRSLIARHVDGLIFAGGRITDRKYTLTLREILNDFREQGGAVVMLSPHSYAAASVTPQNQEGARLLAKWVIGHGHRTIAFIEGPAQILTSQTRKAGYEEALQAAGLEVDASLHEPGGFTVEGGAAATRTLLTRRPDITAIIAGNDLMAIGALAQLRAMGRDVPDNVSVTGFDDIQLARFASPPLTTIRVPMYEMGFQGAGLALEILAGGSPASISLETSLCDRASVGPARGRRRARLAGSRATGGEAGG